MSLSIGKWNCQHTHKQQWPTTKEVRSDKIIDISINLIAGLIIPGRRTRSGRNAPVVSPPTTRRTRKTTIEVIKDKLTLKRASETGDRMMIILQIDWTWL